MAGRGRGRGKGFTFDIAQIGFQKGEALPAAIQQPPPLFPPLEFKPVPLSSTEADEYLLALKQEFRGIMQDSDYFVKPDTVKKDVQRYSDKYKEQKSDSSSKWEPDWNRFPAELKEKTKRKQQAMKPNLASAKRSNAGNLPDVTKRLNELEKNDNDDEDEDEEQNERGEEEQEYDEEEQEEDNDYLVSHYDDGEEVGFQDDDDMDEGPTY